MSKLTGVTFTTTFFSGNNINAAINALDRGEADLMPTIMKDHPRASSLLLSAPYLRTHIIVVMRSDAPPFDDVSRLKSMKVAGLMSIPIKFQKLGWNMHIIPTPPPEGLRGVATGRFDAFLGEQAIIANEFKIAGLVGLASLLLGGLWLFYYRKRLQGIRNGIAALEPHLLCVHIDQNITITGVTEAICKATGYTEEDLMGKSLHVLGAPPVGGKARLAKLLDTVSQGQTWRGEAKLSRKDGSELWTDVIISPSRRKNDTIGYSIIYQDASKRKHYEKLAIRDELTDLYNRRHFNALAPDLLQKAARKNLYIGLFLFDVDNFKKYNDTYSHPAGDDVLAAIGRVIKSRLKRGDDLSFRLGGEEFGILVLFSAIEGAVAPVPFHGIIHSSQLLYFLPYP